MRVIGLIFGIKTSWYHSLPFKEINEKLMEVFPRLFDGGEAKLVLIEPDKPLESGVELMIHPPGKKLTRLSLLSGGEKALSAIAFIFSIFFIKTEQT